MVTPTAENLMSAKVARPKPEEADPGVPLYEADGSPTESGRIAPSLRADAKRLATGEADNLGEDAVAWLRHLMETFHPALLVRASVPGEDRDPVPFSDAAPTGAASATPITPSHRKRPTRLQGGLKTPSSISVSLSDPNAVGLLIPLREAAAALGLPVLGGWLDLGEEGHAMVART